MNTLPPLLLNPRAFASGFAVFLAVLILALPSASQAASGTWLNTGAADANWSTTSNWTGGTVPGATSGTTNADTATFNTAVGTYGTSGTPVLIDSGRNLKSITFDLATAGAYFIGTTGGNSLLLSSTGAITMNAAVANTETINAPLVIQGAAGTYAFTNNATDNSKLLNIGGGVTGGAAGATVLTLSGANTGNNTVSGVIGNGSATTLAVTKSGAGTWVLSNANTYTGLTTVSGGTLSLAHAGGTIADTAAVTISSGATLDVAQSDTVGAVTISNGGTISGAGTLTGASYAVTTGGNPIISANLAGSGVLSSAFTPAIITITGNNSSWSGTIGTSGTTMASTLLVSNKNALGTGTVYLSGSLQASADLSGANAIGNNLVTTGATVSGTNNVTLGGSVTNTTGTSFKNNITGGTLVLSGPVYLSEASGTGRTLTIAGTGNTTISGVISNFNGSGTAGTLSNGGTGITTLTNANTYTGATTVTSGTLALAGASGSLTGTSSMTFTGGTFLVDNQGVGNNNNSRLADTLGTTLNNGGIFKYLGSDQAATNSTETIGAVTLSGGVSTITVGFNGTNAATLSTNTGTGLTRAANAGIALINGTNLGSTVAGSGSVGQFVTATAPTLTGTTAGGSTGINTGVFNTKIVPFLLGESGTATTQKGTATGTANTFVTFNATTGYRPLNPTDEFTNNSIASGNNTYITGATTAASTAAINSLVINGGNLSIDNGATLTDTSGALLFVTSNSIKPSGSTGILGFGATEGIVSVNSGVRATISSAVTGSAGMTVYGPGILTLSGNNTSLSGNLAVGTGGSVAIGSNTALGSMLVLKGAIQAANSTISITNKVRVGGTIGGSSDLTLAGNGAGNPALANAQFANNFTTVNNTGTTTVSGIFSLCDLVSGINNSSNNLSFGSSANVVVTGAIQDNNSGNDATATNAPAFQFLGTGANLSITPTTNNGYGKSSISTTIVTSTTGYGYNTLTIGGPGGAGATITPFGATSLTNNNSSTTAPFFLQAATSGQILGNNITAGGSSVGYGFAGANNLTIGGTFTTGATANTISNISTATLTYANTVTLGSNLAIAGSGNTTFSGASTLAGGARNFSTFGTGTITLSGTNNLTGLTAFSGGTVVLDYSAANANRLTQNTVAAGNVAALTLAGTNLQLNGGAFAQTLGTPTSGTNGTTLGMGYSTITQTNSGTSTIALGGITRSTGSTVDFGANSIASTTTANANISGGQQTILSGYATVGGTTFAVSGTGGTPGVITGLVSYNTGFLATKDVDAATGASAPGAMTINSLRFNNTGSSTVTLGGAMVVATGGILVTSNVGANNIAINSSSLSNNNTQDLVITQNNTAGTLTISSQINATGGTALTKNGPGTLILTSPSNSNPGNGTYINGGILSVGASANFGAGVLALNGGTLEATGTFATLSRTIQLGQNGGTFQVDPTFTLTLTGAVTSTSTYGGLTKTGTGTLLLSGAGTYQGPTNINAGTVQLGNVLGLGNSAASSNRTMSPVTVNTGGTLDIAGFAPNVGNLTLAGGTISDSAGTGSLSAYTVTLQSGTVSAKLADMVITGNSSNSINVNKTTGGTVTLTGASTYTGNTNVNAGTLLVNNTSGSGTGTGQVAVNGGTLGGSGTISGGVTINSGGTLAPGNSPGLLTVGSLVLNAGSTTTMQLDAITTRGTTYDAVNSNGALIYGGALTISLNPGTATIGDYDLFDFTSQSGSFTGGISFVGGGAGTFDYTTGVLSLTAVPEPSTWALLAFSLMTVIVFRRRRA